MKKVRNTGCSLLGRGNRRRGQFEQENLFLLFLRWKRRVQNSYSKSRWASDGGAMGVRQVSSISSTLGCQMSAVESLCHLDETACLCCVGSASSAQHT
jgi:hypothetical protein